MTETQAAPQRKYRKDYTPPAFWIERVELSFDLHEDHALVRARLECRRNGEGDAPLVLDGEELETLAVRLDGVELQPGRYVVEPETLTVPDVPDAFVLETEVRLRPQDNLALSGLYKSSGNFCTQCEAEGFRRITWSLDRPDVMARYTTTITADRASFPVLLSNGNRVEEQQLDDGRQRVVWVDPFPKPCYLFALVAGDLVCKPGSFTTASGRDVRLEIWVEPQNIDACGHALQSLQRAMKWDEEVFGLEYDLDVYMLVAVGDFNMGAMENKGLNLFNSKYVLARPETATDDDYEAIEGVIAHEYFHNWTGNRVTCRDWFQLTLKEGLTVFRDQQFSADMTSAAVKRIDDVRTLRAVQFPEDAGPMAHPIRPESYIEMDNFYTATVYEKGAEVIRMYHTLLGPDGFRRGMDLYFERHDGQAVTCDDFRAAMADANGRDLTQLERWYLQAGTPRLEVQERWDATRGALSLTFCQLAPEGRAEGFLALHVPVRMGLVGPFGHDVPLELEGEERASDAPTERVLELTELEQTFTFVGLQKCPVSSVLRGASAPLELRLQRSREDLAFLMANDADPFNRWDAGQVLFGDAILHLTQAQMARHDLQLPDVLRDAFRAVLLDETLDGSIKSLMLALPTERVLAQRMDVVDPDALFAAREFVKRELARELRDELEAIYQQHLPSGPYSIDKASIDRRRMQNAALAYLTTQDDPALVELAKDQFDQADNMTDGEAALACLVARDVPQRQAALDAFYARWRRDPLVLDKWFALQASCRLPGAPARVRALAGHADFNLTNPNRARALVATFAGANPTGFHDASGDGYAFVAEQVLALDPRNPQVASRLVGAFNPWRRYDGQRQALARGQLERIRSTDGLSRNVFEIVERALAE
jgi:aminopeptidase N